MNKLNVSTRFRLAAISAAVSFIAFSNTNSAFADKHHCGWAYVVGGILFAVFTVYDIVTVARDSK